METAAGKASVKQTGSLTTSVNSWKSALFRQEAGLENDAAALNLTVNLFWILCKTDASYFGTALDDH